MSPEGPKPLCYRVFRTGIVRRQHVVKRKRISRRIRSREDHRARQWCRPRGRRIRGVASNAPRLLLRGGLGEKRGVVDVEGRQTVVRRLAATVVDAELTEAEGVALEVEVGGDVVRV